MPSPPPTHTNVHPQILPTEETENPKTFWPAARRTPSFSSSHSRDSSFRSSSSSSSSFSSIDQEFPPFKPTTPLKLKGIPFSWEQTPGIPKPQNSMNKTSSRQLLPLPPAGNSNSTVKKRHKFEEISPKQSHHTGSKFTKDPFLVALLECSKDDDAHFGRIWKGSSRAARSLSGRFGFINMYANSCKSTCAVSEAMVYLPRSSSHSLVNRRSS